MFWFSCNAVQACVLVACCIFCYCEICSAAYIYVMTTNWFRLLLNAAIQLPSGPSVSVYLCVRDNKREILLKCILWIHLPPYSVLHKYGELMLASIFPRPQTEIS